MNIAKFKEKLEDSFKDFKRGDLKVDYRPEDRFKMHMMTSNNIIYLLSTAVECMRQQEKYLCYGVYRGAALLPVAFNNPDKKCLGMDSWCKFDNEKKNDYIVREQIKQHGINNVILYTADYRDFYKKWDGGKFGVQFLDGDHTYEATLEALEMSEPHMAINSIMVIDDTDRSEVKKAVNDFLEKTEGGWGLIYDIEGAKYIKDKHMGKAWWSGIMVIGRGK